MSAAWETTTEDVATVLDAHGIEYTDEQLNDWHNNLDFDDIEDNLLHYNSMNAQTNSMLMDIEDQLMEGVIPKGEKKFVMQEGDETEVDDWNEDDGEEEDELDEEQE